MRRCVWVVRSSISSSENNEGRVSHVTRCTTEARRPCISSIAGATGFSNPAFFSTQFRKNTGKSPSGYRKALLETRGKA
jgi:transcriptional regulator GlxA family with amidase domain